MSAMDQEQLAMGLRCAYYALTEEFDRTICTGGEGPDGGIMPATPREQGEINAHARAVALVVEGMAREARIDEGIWKNSKEWALRLGYYQQQMQAERFGCLRKVREAMGNWHRLRYERLEGNNSRPHVPIIK